MAGKGDANIPQPGVLVRKKREAQDRVLSLLSQGVTVSDAMDAVGRARPTFYHWSANEPWFRDRAESVRAREMGEEAPPFTAFRKAFFGFETFWHQEKIVTALEAAPARSVTMVLLPPGAGKTTVLEDYVCYLLATDPNERICVISEAQAHARKIIRRVSNRMTDRSLFGAFIDRFGPFKADDNEQNRPWSADVLTMVQASSGERDYSLECRGAGSSIYGARFSRILLDDVQSLKNLAATPSLVEYFRQDVYTRLPPDMTTGRVYIVGTRVGNDDFYETLLTEGIVDELIKIPALIEHPDDPDVKHSYWPKRTMADGTTVGFDVDDLAQIEAKVGETTWSRVYMQEPVSKRGQTFSEKAIRGALDEERSILDTTNPGMLTIAALDPALAGHSVFRVASLTYDKLFLLDGRNEEGLARFEDMWEIINDLSAMWHPSLWIIEGNAIQGGIARSDRIEEVARQHGFHIVSHQTGRNKFDDVIGVTSMSQSFATNSISIPWKDDVSQRAFALLPEELRRWRPDVPTKLLRQDEVMCLWFLHLHWQQLRHSLATRIDGRILTQRLPWRPMGLPTMAAVG